MELVIFKVTFINETVICDHGSLDSLIIVPGSIKDRTIRPNHFTLTITHTLSEVTFVLCDIPLISRCTRQRALVVHLTLTIRSAIFKHTDVFITVLKDNRALFL